VASAKKKIQRNKKIIEKNQAGQNRAAKRATRADQVGQKKLGQKAWSRFLS